jgi:hypothetical protein
VSRPTVHRSSQGYSATLPTRQGHTTLANLGEIGVIEYGEIGA